MNKNKIIVNECLLLPLNIFFACGSSVAADGFEHIVASKQVSNDDNQWWLRSDKLHHVSFHFTRKNKLTRHDAELALYYMIHILMLNDTFNFTGWPSVLMQKKSECGMTGVMTNCHTFWAFSHKWGWIPLMLLIISILESQWQYQPLHPHPSEKVKLSLSKNYKALPLLWAYHLLQFFQTVSNNILKRADKMDKIYWTYCTLYVDAAFFTTPSLLLKIRKIWWNNENNPIP